MLGMTAGLLVPVAVRAQDTTTTYPWRLSYFPYVLASPNDGVIGVARAVWFRQSRWDARVPVAAQVSIDAGYSTKDAWLARVEGDFPQLAPGWRLQAEAEARSTPDFATVDLDDVAADRQVFAVEVTRHLAGPVMLALRGGMSHTAALFYSPGANADLSGPRNSETDWHGRLALIVDRRDREYDTRHGALVQAGVLAGHFGDTYRGLSLDDDDYTGWYALAAGWLPLSARTRVTARIGARALSAGAFNGFEAERTLPAWEDDITVFGGAESNRGLPEAAVMGRGVLLASAELRHDVVTVPAASLALIAFADAGRVFVDNACDVARSRADPPIYCGSSGTLRLTLDGWTVAPGVGVALRLLRDAVLEATVARAEHATRIYVSSGWSW